MNINPFKPIKEHFSLKLFVVFGIMAFLIIGLFTGLYLFRQSRFMTETLIKKGLFQAEMLAHNSRIGVFSENEELLNVPAEASFEQDEVLEVQIFNLEGELLKRLTRTEQGTVKVSDEREEAERVTVLEKVAESMTSIYLEGKNNFEFWAPVMSASRYSMPESLGLDEIPHRRESDIIGFVNVTIDKGGLNRQFNELLVTSVMVVILFLVVTFFASYFVARGISKPLRRLIEGVHIIGMGGVVEKLPVETRDEIGLLAEAFNEMSESLEKREDDLRTANLKLLNQHEQRKILSKRLIYLLERDRDQVAMELHDHIGQILTSLKINLEVIQDQLRTDDPDLEARIKASRERAVHALKGIKNISRGLKPSILDSLGLISSLRELFNEIESDTGISINFFTRNVPNRFKKEKELAIYRIVQEALNNIIRHAQASSVFINLIKKQDKIMLSIEDNGVGFDVGRTMEITSEKRPFGLLIMRERIIQLKGEFDIESNIGKGTHLLVEIPI